MLGRPPVLDGPGDGAADRVVTRVPVLPEPRTPADDRQAEQPVPPIPTDAHPAGRPLPWAPTSAPAPPPDVPHPFAPVHAHVASPVQGGPAGVGPGAVGPGAVGPGAVEPPLVEPPVVEPPVVDTAVVEPSVVGPSVVDPSVVDPAALDPSVVDSPVVDPAVVDPPVVDPAAVDSPVVDSSVVDSSVVDSSVVDSSVVDSSVVDSAVVRSAVVGPPGDAPDDDVAPTVAVDPVAPDSAAPTGAVPWSLVPRRERPRVYVDGSALTRYLRGAPSRDAWLAWVAEHEDRLVTTFLGVSELRRVARPRGVEAHGVAHDVTDRVEVVRFSDQSLHAAARVATVLPSFVALHVGAAVAHAQVGTVATYDVQLAQVAALHGLEVVSPGWPAGWWERAQPAS